MSSNKPLIFVHPLSETLKQLKEVIEENAESDGIEVFEVESLQEMAQLLPTIGPSVTIISNPRKCAMLLQANRKTVLRLKSKVILLSPKFIPRKTLEKFMKIALTDCITEPVAPKTLLYKVKLMLRSLPSANAEDDQDVVISADEDEQNTNSEAQHVEKGVKLDGHLKGKVGDKKETNLEIEDVDEDGIHTNKEADKTKKDDLLRGDLKPELKLDQEDDEDHDNKKYDGPIDGYLRGKVGPDFDFEEEQEDANEEDDLSGDDLLEQAKAELNLELTDDEDIYHQETKEEEEAPKQEKESEMATLDLEPEDEKNASMENHNKLDGHLRGKVNQADFDFEEDEITEERDDDGDKPKNKSPFDDLEPTLQLEDDEPEITLEKEEGPKGKVNNKINPSLDLEDEDVTEDHEGEDAHLSGDLSGKGEKSDQLDKFYRGDLEESLELEDEDNVFDLEKEKARFKEKNQNTSLDLEDDLSPNEKKKKKNDEKMSSLDFDPELDLEENELDHEKMTAQAKKKRAEEDPNLALELEEFKERKKKEAAAANKSAKGLFEKKSLQLEDEDGDKGPTEEKERGKLNRKKEMAKLDLEAEDDQDNTIKNHGVDHIQKYYGMKGGDALEKGADWNGLKKKDEIMDYGPSNDNKGSKELIIPKIDRGEQTIDYRKLKEEFDISITVDRDRKVINGEFDINETQGEQGEKMQLDLPEQDLFDQPLTEEEQEIISAKEPIFEPNSKGLEHVIRMVETYQNPKKDLYSIFYKIANNVYKEVKGLTSFFVYNPQSELFIEQYSGHLFIDTEIPKELRESKWSTLKKDQLELWSTAQLPSWQDHTFQEKDNQFIYPFFMGVNHMGFAVVTFNNQLKEEKSHCVEVILESGRGGYMNYYSSIKRSMDRDKAKDKDKEKSEKKGLLKGLFNKKKAS